MKFTELEFNFGLVERDEIDVFALLIIKLSSA